MTERALTVVQVLPALEGGDMDRYVLEVAQELVRRGHASWVVSGGGQLVSRLTGQGSRHLHWSIGEKSLWTLRWVRRLRAFLTEQRVDILHAHSRIPAWVAYRAWKGMPVDRRPRFVTSLDEVHAVSRYSSVLTRGEKIVAVSHAARRHILEQYPRVEPGCVEVIPRGLDPAVFPHGYRPADSWYQRWFNQYPFLLERFVVTLPGALTPRRDHRAFIRLVEGLLAAGVPTHGLLVGADDPRHGKYAAKLRREIARRGLAERISFTGPRMDSREIHAASNLVLSLPESAEFFDRAVLESLSMGVPVLGYDQGGVGELLAELFPQGRVPPGDVEALLAAALAIHQQCPEVLPARNHDLRGMLDSTLALYRGLSG